METDTWYQRKLVEDVPQDEMWAALEDVDLDDTGEEGDDDVESESQDDEWEEHVTVDENLSDEESDEPDSDSGADSEA